MRSVAKHSVKPTVSKPMDSKKDIRNKKWLSKWGRLRQKGWLYYSFVRGCLLFCPLIAVVYFAAQWITVSDFPGNTNTYSDLLIALIAGITFAILRYINNEIRYRRLGARYPSAVRW